MKLMTVSKRSKKKERIAFEPEIASTEGEKPTVHRICVKSVSNSKEWIYIV